MKSKVDVFLERFDDDTGRAMCWLLGYVESVEDNQNQIRELAGIPARKTLSEDLEESCKSQ